MANKSNPLTGVFKLAVETTNLRKQRKWSQAKLAKVAGVTVLDVKKIESATTNIGIASILRIAAALERHVYIKFRSVK